MARPEMIERVYEVDPPASLRFGADMQVIAFIADREVVEISRHLARTSLSESGGPALTPGFQGVPTRSDCDWGQPMLQICHDQVSGGWGGNSG